MIGDRVKAERTQRSWSQQELADRAGLEQSYISKLELNLRPRPSGEALQKLAQAFGITIDDLLKESPIPSEDLLHAPAELLRAVWPPEEIQRLEDDWPDLGAEVRQEWWTTARRWYAKRREIAEARRLLDEVNRYHTQQDASEAQRRATQQPRVGGR